MTEAIVAKTTATTATCWPSTLGTMRRARATRPMTMRVSWMSFMRDLRDDGRGGVGRAGGGGGSLGQGDERALHDRRDACHFCEQRLQDGGASPVHVEEQELRPAIADIGEPLPQGEAVLVALEVRTH